MWRHQDMMTDEHPYFFIHWRLRPSQLHQQLELFDACAHISSMTDDDGVDIPSPTSSNFHELLGLDRSPTRDLFRLSGSEAARFMGYVVLEGTKGETYENSSGPIAVTNLIDAAWLSQMLFSPSFAHIAHPHIN
jgi:hypothetical protein